MGFAWTWKNGNRKKNGWRWMDLHVCNALQTRAAADPGLFFADYHAAECLCLCTC